MSNAMRFGKRTLAGVAAGALAVGALSIASATSATAKPEVSPKAGTAANIIFGVPSVTVVGSGYLAATGIPTPVYLVDAAGDLVDTSDDTTGLSVEITVTRPSTATVDDSLAVNSFTGSSGTAIKKASSTYTSAALAGITISPNGNVGTSWDSVAAATGGQVGTYTITARLFATGSGTVVSTASIPFTVSNKVGAPTPTVQFVDDSPIASANIINGLGATMGDSVGGPDGSFYVYLTNSTSGPYYMLDDSVSVTATNTVGVSSLSTGKSGGLQTGPIPIYQFPSTGGQWDTGLSASVTATASPVPGTDYTGSITVGMGAANALTSAPTVRLTTAGAYQPNPAVATYEVPPGTSPLTFSVATANNVSTSVAYNTSSTETLTFYNGQLSTSGGAIAMSNDSGSVSVVPNADASASGADMTITVGDYKTGSRTTTVTVQFRKPAATVTPTAGITKVSSPTVVTGTILSQYGATLPGTWAITAKNGSGASCSATSLAAATANADGTFELTIPATFAATSPGTKTFTICASNGFSETTADEVVTYTASGGLNSLSVAATAPALTSSQFAVVATPPSGVANLQTDTTNSVTNPASANVNTAGTGTAFEVTVTTNPGATFSISGPSGVLFTTSTTGSLAVSAGSNPLVSTTGTGTGTSTKVISVFATKPGTHEVVVTAGTSTAKLTFVAGVAIGSGRTLTADPTSITLAPNEFKAVNVKLVDLYGNPVPDDTGITASLAGGGTLTAATATNANGVSTAYYTAPLGTGKGQVLWSMAAGKYVAGAITGYPAAVNTASTAIDVTGTPSGDKTIVIVGERATVSGKPGVRVEGATTGFDVGSKMVPSIRFPGETEYSAGTARPTTSVAGDFTWQRKTGKKIYVFFTNEAGDVKSNRVIIPAS